MTKPELQYFDDKLNLTDAMVQFLKLCQSVDRDSIAELVDCVVDAIKNFKGTK